MDQLLGQPLYSTPRRTGAFGRGGRTGAYGRGTGPWNRRRPPRTRQCNASESSPSPRNSGGCQSKQGSTPEPRLAPGNPGNPGEDHSKQGSTSVNSHAPGNSGGGQSKQGSTPEPCPAPGNPGEDHSKQGSTSANSHTPGHSGGGQSKQGSTPVEFQDDEGSYMTPDAADSPSLFGGSTKRSGSRQSGSQRSRFVSEPWNRPEKMKNMLNDKVRWNGHRKTFGEYRKTIEGHLLQMNAGYLIKSEFLAEYETQ